MKKKVLWSLFVLTAIIFIPTFSFAADVAATDTGDTTFAILSTALVFLMTPGLALFYGGMARKKNVLNTMMNSFVIIALVSVQWVIVGYTIAFGPDKFSLFGGLDFLGFNGVGGAPSAYAATIPHSAFSMFQLMFAIITPALITGAFAERMKFPAFLAFILLWSTFVYDPLCHWVWGIGGWIRTMGALDFAGGTVVHISSGIAGLVAALVLGKRKGHGSHAMIPHNIPFVVLGAGILWFGWFGFNAGSALSAAGDGAGGNLAMTAFVTTNTAAAAAVLSWVIIEWFHRGKPTVLGAATGAVVGLVAITPAAGFVTPMSAIIMGLLVSPICYFMVSFVKGKLGYDDALDAFGCHGVGGFFGAIATGFFATKSVNAAGADGLFYGNPGLVVTQLIAAGATVVFSALLTFIILKLVSLFTPLRATERDEEEGMDIALHGEDAYPDFAADSSMSI